MRDLLTARQAANRLQIKENTLAKWRLLGKGPPFVRIGSKAIRYQPERIQEWIDSNQDAICEPSREYSREPPCESPCELTVNSRREINVSGVIT